MNRIQEDNRNLRQQLKELTQEARLNGAIMERFLERELILLSAESLPALLNAFTDGLRESFELEAVSLILPDTNHDVRHLLHHGGTSADAFPAVVFVDKVHHASGSLAGLKRPRLGRFLPSHHSALFPGIENMGSVALLPMVRYGQQVACLCMGSADPLRFTHHHASDFLYRLATIGALCLENAVNREQLILSGLTDPLTGLHNRRFLERKLKEETERAARYNHPLSCLFVDADHFKRINDRHGHATGDTALRELADCIRGQLRATDLATRYGGEELALLLPHTDENQAILLAERIRMATEELVLLGDLGEQVRLTVSIGASTLRIDRGHARNPELGRQLLKEADQAVYRAKEAGRNRVKHYRPDPLPGPRCISNPFA